METRYAKKDIYADVPEEGGNIRRLVAAKGQPVPPGFVDLVDKSDTQEAPLTESDLIAGDLARATSARKETPVPEEPDHEEFRLTTASAGTTEAEREEAKPKRRRAASQPNEDS